MSEEQKKQLQTQLWNIANELRGKMNPDEFRDYILGFIFYKYLSEKITIFANDLLKADGIRYDWDIDEDAPIHDKYIEAVKVEAIDTLGYFLNPKELFHYVATHGTSSGDLIENLERILNNIENSTMGHDSEDDFESLFSELDLNSQRLGKTVAARSELIAKVLIHLDKIDFQLQNSQIDVLGDAYEYMIGQFASGAGKKAGEFYTPQEVSQVLARIVTDGKKRLKSVYDPTCGSGSLLLRVAKYVDEVGHFYGQELNNTTYNLARMNMILHDVSYDRFDIKQEDTLEHPQHKDMRFEAIVANPPFSAKWSADPIFLQDDRFRGYGKLAPSSKADYAFIQHMIYHLDDNGTLAVVMPHGALYRGNSEHTIRKYLVENGNYLDAVIGLPINIFYQTKTPTCIMVFKKFRRASDSILFIDASSGYKKIDKQNQLRKEDIEKIINTYESRASEKEYSACAQIDDIKANDYDLSILKYVDAYIPEKVVDLVLCANNMEKVTQETTRLLDDLNSKLDELSLPRITGSNLGSLGEYFDGLKQRIFSQDIDVGNQSDWADTSLREVLSERKLRNTGNKYDEVFSVAKNKGVINQKEHLGRSYAAEDISNYKVILPGDIAYTKSPTSGFPFGIIKQNKLGRPGVVSVLYAIYQPKSDIYGKLLDYYFSSPESAYNYLVPIVNKGAKNTINISNDHFLDGYKVYLPKDEKSAIEIIGLLDGLKDLINRVQS